MTFNLAKRLITATAAASARPLLIPPIKQPSEASILGQTILFFQSAPDEHLTASDLTVRYSSFTSAAIFAALKRGIEHRAFVFDREGLKVGPNFNAIQLRKLKIVAANSVRYGSAVYQVLADLKRARPNTVIMESELTLKTYFSQLFGHAISKGLVTVVYIGGERGIKAGPNLMSYDAIPADGSLSQLLRSLKAQSGAKTRLIRVTQSDAYALVRLIEADMSRTQETTL